MLCGTYNIKKKGEMKDIKKKEFIHFFLMFFNLQIPNQFLNQTRCQSYSLPPPPHSHC
jgi:hypothetical protein